MCSYTYVFVQSEQLCGCWADRGGCCCLMPLITQPLPVSASSTIRRHQRTDHDDDDQSFRREIEKFVQRLFMGSRLWWVNGITPRYQFCAIALPRHNTQLPLAPDTDHECPQPQPPAHLPHHHHHLQSGLV